MAQSYTIHELASIIKASLHGKIVDSQRISWLLTDSRKISFARSSVFFAIKTSKNDGHKFIGELLAKGVSCFVVSKLPADPALLHNASFLLTSNTLGALQMLAAFHRARFHYPVVGITGSNGKTIVKEWLAQLLAPTLNVVKNPRSYNSQTGVPLSVWNMDFTHELGIFEAGISQPGEMGKLEKVIKPDKGIFTNIGPAHDEGFSDWKQKIQEKLKLFSDSELLIYSSENHFLEGQILEWAKVHPGVSLKSWGTRITDAIRVNVTNSGKSDLLEIHYLDRRYDFQIPFTDKASVENLVHCLAFIIVNNLSDPGLPARVMNLEAIAMRMEMKQGINNCVLINDAYNADVYALGIALDFLVSNAGQRKRVLIISDILQSGLPPNELYARVAGILKEKSVSILVGIGIEISKFAHLFSSLEAFFYPNTETFLQNHNLSGFVDVGILLKGARDFGFERIGQKLQLQDHQTVLEIDLDAMVNNLNVFRSLLNPGVRTMAMVKAFGYGSGSHEIAGILQFHGVDYLAVAFADEGNNLRAAGIYMPIVVLNPEVHNMDILFRYNLEPEVYSMKLLERLLHEIKHFNAYHAENPFPIHIKLDTGMHRLGFLESELGEMLSLLKNNPSVRVASVFSHLAASDLPEFDDFSKHQIDIFARLTSRIESSLGYSFLRHIANTAAVSRLPGAQFDMVRLGIGLYGVDGSGALAGQLQNVTTFRSVISQVRFLQAGESVGYNRAAIIQRPTKMAVVPVGYADGLNRHLGNGNAFLWVKGHLVPTLGNISMDMCAIDITDTDAGEGDEVIIFGKELPVQEMASRLKTIPYEIFTSIPQRVKRVYYSE
jgi:alanine racemase